MADLDRPDTVPRLEIWKESTDGPKSVMISLGIPESLNEVLK
jgi:hypothetical protein